MLELFKKSLDDEGVFNGEIPELIQTLAKAIDVPTVPDRMKLSIAVSEFILFFSQFQKNIRLHDDAIIPINAITFAISGSGSGKDLAKSSVRACFSDAYKEINLKRLEMARDKAIQAAQAAGEDEPFNTEVYDQYYSHPSPLFSATNSTIEGLFSDFNEHQDFGIGAGMIYSSEIGDELTKGIDEMMTFMAEIYDKGNKEVKA